MGMFDCEMMAAMSLDGFGEHQQGVIGFVAEYVAGWTICPDVSSSCRCERIFGRIWDGGRGARDPGYLFWWWGIWSGTYVTQLTHVTDLTEAQLDVVTKDEIWAHAWSTASSWFIKGFTSTCFCKSYKSWKPPALPGNTVAAHNFPPSPLLVHGSPLQGAPLPAAGARLPGWLVAPTWCTALLTFQGGGRVLPPTCCVMLVPTWRPLLPHGDSKLQCRTFQWTCSLTIPPPKSFALQTPQFGLWWPCMDICRPHPACHPRDWPSEGRPTRVDATTRLPSDIHRVFSLWPPPPPGLEGNHSHPGLNTFSRISIVNRQIFGILRNKLRQIMRIQLGAENQFWPPHFSDEQSSFTQFHFCVWFI